MPKSSKILQLMGKLGGGSGLPSGGAPNQQLVTDANGNTVWEDRLAYKVVSRTNLCSDVTVTCDTASGNGYRYVDYPSWYPSGDLEVIWDGATYSGWGNPYIYSDSDTDNGYPYYIMTGSMGAVYIYANTSGEHTFSINKVTTTVNPVAYDYLPSDVMYESNMSQYRNAVYWGTSSISDGYFKDNNYIVSLSTSSTYSIGANAFYACRCLISADIVSGKTFGDYAFYQCSLLSHVYAPNLTTIGQHTFFGCRALTEAFFPLITSVPNNAFNACANLRDVDLTSVTSIGVSGLASCKRLALVDLPVCTSIDNYAFNHCSSLKTVILRSETLCTLTNTNAFVNTPIASGEGYIYVPDDLVDEYTSDSVWSTYTEQIKPISEYTE